MIELSCAPRMIASGRTINVAGPVVAPLQATELPSDSRATLPSTVTLRKFESPMKSATNREVGRW